MRINSGLGSSSVTIFYCILNFFFWDRGNFFEGKKIKRIFSKLFKELKLLVGEKNWTKINGFSYWVVCQDGHSDPSKLLTFLPIEKNYLGFHQKIRSNAFF